MWMQAFARGNDLLRDFGIPPRDLTDEINARFGITQLLEDGVNGITRETLIEIPALFGIGQLVVMSK
jgi:hypothetical protein